MIRISTCPVCATEIVPDDYFTSYESCMVATPIVPYDRGHLHPIEDIRINPYDKEKRNVGLSSKERFDLHGICRLGPEQLLVCWKSWDVYLNRLSFERSCNGCKYCMVTRYATPTDKFDRSIWKPNIFEPQLTKVIFNELEKQQKATWCVYFVSDGEYVKVGMTNKIESRFSALQTSNARKLELLFYIPLVAKEACCHVERMFHQAYSDYRVNGEWFDILKKLALPAWKRFLSIYVYDDLIGDSDQ